LAVFQIINLPFTHVASLASAIEKSRAWSLHRHKMSVVDQKERVTCAFARRERDSSSALLEDALRSGQTSTFPTGWTSSLGANSPGIENATSSSSARSTEKP
jgi:hypothetical protein